MEEIEALQRSSATGRIQDIPEFTFIISFLPETGVIVTHKLMNCRFMNNGRDSKEGDMKLEKQIDLVIGEIIWK
jgi:hypothetical protein